MFKGIDLKVKYFINYENSGNTLYLVLVIFKFLLFLFFKLTWSTLSTNEISIYILFCKVSFVIINKLKR